jgi:hypothetical protein
METGTILPEVVLADLARAQRLRLKIQDEIDPQFRIATPKGDYGTAISWRVFEKRRRETDHAILVPRIACRDEQGEGDEGAIIETRFRVWN